MDAPELPDELQMRPDWLRSKIFPLKVGRVAGLQVDTVLPSLPSRHACAILAHAPFVQRARPGTASFVS